ncbi:uncharacterized protein LOC123271702 [Cotesia glomerata]|uniref:uncharacterized protein LOC123271702 n=1 Tax=Cotesia glomerata TaxID=32391 RepID=UPI001D009FC1|nr:uncharacterized protein LOC123271702 [Cotesia glomerata]
MQFRHSTVNSVLSNIQTPELDKPSTSQSTSFHSSSEHELEKSISSFSDDLKRHTSDLEDPYSENIKKQRKIDVVSPAVVSALDRTNTGNRYVVYILGAVSESLGMPTEDTNLSYNTVRRRRLEARQDIVDDLRNNIQFPGSLILHWDTKFLQDICIYDKVDRLAVLVSGLNFEQLLGIPKTESGAGEHQAMSIIDLLDRWGITNCIKGLCFDTTASNSGPYSGACVLLERILEKKFLYFACRNHMYELVLQKKHAKLVYRQCQVQMYRHLKDSGDLGRILILMII